MKILVFMTNLSYKKKEAYVGLGWINAFIEQLTASGMDREKPELVTSFFSDEVSQLTIDSSQLVPQYVIPAYVRKTDKLRRRLTFVDHLFNERKLLIQEVIDKVQPDLIHVFGTENPFGLLAGTVNIPVVVHIQGILNPYLEKYFPAGYGLRHLAAAVPFKRLLMFSSYFGDYFTFKKLAKRELEIFKCSRYLTGRTAWDSNVTKMLSPAARYFHIDEMLRDKFYGISWQPAYNRPHIKLVSVINPDVYKGIETIIRVAALLRQHPNIVFDWTVAGVPPDNVLVKLFLKKVGENAKQLNITFAGPLQPTELANTLLDADIFIHPSHIDNSPNSLCEAMLLGMPVIATAVGGIPTLITNNQDGILVQDGEPYSFAGAVLQLAADKEQAIRLGSAARKKALERHDREKILRDTLDMYSAVLRSHKQLPNVH